MKLNQIQDALECCEEALKINPKSIFNKQSIGTKALYRKAKAIMS